MASTVPPVKGSAYTTEICLVSQADTDIFQTSVTLAAGDVIVYQDGVLDGNVDTLPSEIGSTGILVVALSADEMNADRVVVKFTDAAGDEWQDALIVIHTAAQTLDTMDTNIDSILTDTGTDGVVVNTYTSAGKAEVQSEVNDALVAVDLDHLIETTAGSEGPTDGSYLDQIMHKDNSQTFNATTDSLEAIRDTLTEATITTVSGVVGDAITVVPYTTWEFTVSGLADLSGAVADTGVLFTAKADKSDDDSAAILQVRETTGLIYINGAAGTAAKATLVVGANEDSITVTVNASQTAIDPQTCVWDIKQILTTAEDADQMASGVFTIAETAVTKDLTAT